MRSLHGLTARPGLREMPASERQNVTQSPFEQANPKQPGRCRSEAGNRTQPVPAQYGRPVTAVRDGIDQPTESCKSIG